MVTVYVLKLEKGKYYVGKTNHDFQRLEQHKSGRGASWTKKYKPLSIVSVQSGMKSVDEDLITLQTMKKFGIENVRGGKWYRVKMSKKSVLEIEELIKANKIKKPKKTTRNRSKKNQLCSRCGRNSHSLSKCYATTHRNGTMIGTPYKQIDKATYREILEERRQLKQARLEVEDSKKDSENKQKEIERLRREISDLETAKKETNPDTMTKIIQSLSEDNFTQLATYLSAGALIAGIVAPRVLALGLKNASNQVEYISKLLKKYRK